MYDEELLEDAQIRAEAAIARQVNEPYKAFCGFNAFLNLPVAQRSLRAAYTVYKGDTGAEQGQADNEPLKAAPAYFQAWSSTYDWITRAETHSFYLAMVAREKQAEQQLKDVEAFRDKVKKVSERKLAFFNRFNQICHKRLNLCEQQDLRAQEQAEEWLKKQTDAELAGVTFKPPGKAIMPVPFSEYESIMRAFSRASAVVTDGLTNEGSAIGVNALLLDLKTQRKKDDHD